MKHNIIKLIITLIILPLAKPTEAFNVFHLPNEVLPSYTLLEDDIENNSEYYWQEYMKEYKESLEMLEYYLSDTISFHNGWMLLATTVEMSKLAIEPYEYLYRQYGEKETPPNYIIGLLNDAEFAFRVVNPSSFTEEGEALPITIEGAQGYLKILVKWVETYFSESITIEDPELAYAENPTYASLVDNLKSSKLLLQNSENNLESLQQACHILYASFREFAIQVLDMLFLTWFFSDDVTYAREKMADESYTKGRNSLQIAIENAEIALNDENITIDNLKAEREKFNEAYQIFLSINEAYYNLMSTINSAEFYIVNYSDKDELAIMTLQAAIDIAKRIAEESESFDELTTANTALSTAINVFLLAIEMDDLFDVTDSPKTNRPTFDIQGREVKTPNRNQIYVRNGIRVLFR